MPTYQGDGFELGDPLPSPKTQLYRVRAQPIISRATLRHKLPRPPLLPVYRTAPQSPHLTAHIGMMRNSHITGTSLATDLETHCTAYDRWMAARAADPLVDWWRVHLTQMRNTAANAGPKFDYIAAKIALIQALERRSAIMLPSDLVLDLMLHPFPMETLALVMLIGALIDHVETDGIKMVKLANILELTDGIVRPDMAWARGDGTFGISFGR